MCKSEMNRMAIPAAPSRASAPSGRRRRHALDFLYQDRLQGRILLEGSPGSGRYGRDFVDHVHSLDDLAENRVTPSGRARIERRIVGEIHVERRGSGMG